MRYRAFIIVTFSVLMIISTHGLMIPIECGTARAQNAPTLYDHDAYELNEYVVFEVYYQDSDDDEADGVWLMLSEEDWVEMYNWENSIERLFEAMRTVYDVDPDDL